jgi:hypothetical protein
MATAQPNISHPDWNHLAEELNVNGPDEAMKLAYEIAAYVAEVERSSSHRLLLKEGGKYFNLRLGSIKRRN